MAMTREDASQLDLELAKMEGNGANNSPTLKPTTAVEEGNYLSRERKKEIICELTNIEKPKHLVNYSGDLKSGLVWVLNGQKEVGLQMVYILNGI